MTRIVSDGSVSGSVEDDKSEDELWTAYMVALARQQSCWQLAREAWRNYVATGLIDELRGRVYDECSALNEAWYARANAAYAAWKAVAYPQNGLPVD